MDANVRQEALQLVERAKFNNAIGATVDLADLNSLDAELGNRIPAWYIELLTTVPLSGLELDWQVDGENGGEGSIAWSDHQGIRSESLECYPGLAILARGFVNVGSDPYGSGDSFFMPTDQGENPPVYQVYHDISDDADEILAEGLVQAASSLSVLFRNGHAAKS